MAKDLSGKCFGRLTALKLDRRDEKSNSYWLCKCECGKEVVVLIGSLTSGNTKSCGCYREEQSNKALIERSTTHGETGTRLYNIWRTMKARCGNPKFIGYEYYGGKGITVCDEWSNSYEVFRDWSLNNGYGEHLTIDRKDNDLGYMPVNCRWATYQQQAKNRTNSTLITYKGITKNLTEWANILDVNDTTLGERIRMDWSIKETFETPVGGKR